MKRNIGVVYSYKASKFVCFALVILTILSCSCQSRAEVNLVSIGSAAVLAIDLTDYPNDKLASHLTQAFCCQYNDISKVITSDVPAEKIFGLYSSYQIPKKGFIFIFLYDRGDTVYFSLMDAEGNLVSLINSSKLLALRDAEGAIIPYLTDNLTDFLNTSNLRTDVFRLYLNASLDLDNQTRSFGEMLMYAANNSESLPITISPNNWYWYN